MASAEEDTMQESVAPFPRALAPYCAALFLLAVGVAVGLAASYGIPPIGSLAVFSVLAIFAIHRGVQGPRVDFLPNAMVFMAAVVVFDSYGTPAGAVIVSLAGGLYVPALHRRTWGWAPFNGAVWACSAAVAALAYSAVDQATEASVPVALVLFALPVLAWSASNWALVALSYVVERGSAPRSVLKELYSGFQSELPFTALGFFLGRLYLSLGATVLLLIIVPILIAREMYASYMRMKDSHEETVQMLIRALERKDPYTAGHAERVADYARYIGDELNFMPARLERLRFAAMMHDIGKLVVPNHILNKPGRLTPEEFDRVRMHEKVGVQMLSHIDFLRPIAPDTHGDNMHFDPDDPDHPIEPYIIMIADAYDAMTSTRAYRKALPQQVAFQELRDKAGVQFHPECVEALIRVIERRGEKHGAGFERQTEFDNAPETGLGSAGLGDLVDESTRSRS